jgi:hypothetical protein
VPLLKCHPARATREPAALMLALKVKHAWHRRRREWTLPSGPDVGLDLGEEVRVRPVWSVTRAEMKTPWSLKIWLITRAFV